MVNLISVLSTENSYLFDNFDADESVDFEISDDNAEENKAEDEAEEAEKADSDDVED